VEDEDVDALKPGSVLSLLVDALDCDEIVLSFLTKSGLQVDAPITKQE
jgi:hypothetical protein